MSYFNKYFTKDYYTRGYFTARAAVEEVVEDVISRGQAGLSRFTRGGLQSGFKFVGDPNKQKETIKSKSYAENNLFEKYTKREEFYTQTYNFNALWESIVIDQEYLDSQKMLKKQIVMKKRQKQEDEFLIFNLL